MEEDKMSQLPDDILLLILDKMKEDRMSQLPDDILLLILDKIDIYEAVKTMILSHRWKNVWRSLSGLRFHFHVPSGFYCNSNEIKPIILPQCQRVSQFLSHRDPAAAVHDFHLSYENPGYVKREFMGEWVLYAINHGVQSLRLHGLTGLTLRLPAAFLTCQTLRELELRDWFGMVQVPGRLSLPNLKTIHLHNILLFFDHYDHTMDPFSGLPQLEKLTLTLANHHWKGLVINAPKLRALEINQISDAKYSFSAKEISAPLLTSFRYEAPKAWKCAKVNLPMLEQVYLDIYGSNDNHTNFLIMLHHLQNATSLSLSLDTMKILLTKVGSLKQTPPPFFNIKCLKVMEARRRFSQELQSHVMGYLRGHEITVYPY